MTPLALATRRTRIDPAWIDYNGHLRDGHYALLASDAADAVLDELGLGADHRRDTGCTVYTVELHLHFLAELRVDDVVEIAPAILESDRKRMLTGFRLECARLGAPAAVAELLLLHVRQGNPPRACEFPPGIAQRIAALTLPPAQRARWEPASRAIALRRG